MIRRIGLAALALAALSPLPAQAQVAASGTLRTGGVYRASPPSLSDQQLAPFRLDGAGALVTTANILNLPSVQAISASQLPASLGQKSAANSLSVVLSADGPFRTTAGDPADTQWDGVATSATHTALFKALYGRMPALVSGRVLVDGSAVTQPVSGTLTANLGTLNGAATAANQTSQLTALNAINTALTAATPASQAGPGLGPSAALGVVQQDGWTQTLTGAAAGALTNGTYTTGAIPTAGFQSASIQLINAGGNTVTFEGSNDLTNWVSLSGYQSNNVGTSAPSATSSGASVVVQVPLTTLYVRERISNYVSGTVTAVMVMKVTPIAPIATYVTLGGGINNIGALGAVSGGSGLTTVSRIVFATASTNATVAKSSGGRVYKITGYNNAASLRWLKLYNKNTAPVPGTDTPFFQLPLPLGAFSFDAQDIGYYFSAGIGYAITTGEADNDNNPVTAGDIKNLNVWYQ